MQRLAGGRRRRTPSSRDDLAAAHGRGERRAPTRGRRDRRARRARGSRRSRAASPARSGCRCSTPARCTARSRSPRSSAGVDLDDGDACAAIAPATRDRASSGGVTTLDGRDVSAEIRGPEVTGRGVDGRPRIPRCGRCSSRASGRGSREHGGGRGRRPRHRHRRVPRRAGQGVPHRERRRAGPAPPARRGRRRRARSRSTTCRPRSTRRDAIDTRPGGVAAARGRRRDRDRHHRPSTSTTSSPRSSTGPERRRIG